MLTEDISNVKVLLIEDDPDDVLIFRRRAALCGHWRLEVDDVSDLASGTEALARGLYDVAFLDLRLGGLTVSRGLLEKLKRSAPDVPIVIFTGIEDERVAVEMMKGGASDFLFKDFLDAEALEGCIRHAIAQRRAAERERQAEEALRKSEQHHRQVLEALREVVYMTDLREGTVTYVSPAVGQVLGLEPDRIVGWPLEAAFALVHPDDRGTVRAAVDGERPDARPLGSFEFRIRHSDGHYVWVSDSRRLVRDEAGRAVGAVGTLRDISEQKKAEQDLREGETRYRSLVEDMPALVCRFRSDGVLTFVNDAYCRCFGKSREELFGANLFQFIPEDHRELVREQYMSLTPARPTVTYEHQVLAPDGSIRFQAWTDRALFDADGRPLGFQSVGMDVTERKVTEEALLKSEARYRELAESITDIFFAMDDRLRYTYWNRRSELVTGIKAEDALGKSFYDLFPNARGTVAERRYVEVLRTGQPRHFVNHYAVGDRESYFDIHAYPTERGLAVFARDVTDRVRAEEAVQRERDRAQTYLDLVGVAVIGLDAAWRVTLINRRGCEMLGCAAADVVGKDMVEHFIPPASRENVRETFRLLISGELETTEYHENPILTAQGQERIVAWHNTVLRDGAGSIIGILGSGEDITERRQAQEALHETTERLQATIEASPLAIVLLDGEGRVKLWNPAAERIFGWRQDEALGRVYPPTPPGGEQELHRLLGEVLAGRGFSGVEGARQRRDGSLVHVSLSTAPVRDARGAVIGAIGISMDVTDARKAADALRENEWKYRTIFEQAGSLIMSVDRRGVIVECNGRVFDMLGYERTEVVGSEIGLIVHPDHMAETRACADGVAAAGGSCTAECRFVRKDGSSIWVKVNCSSLDSGQGGPAHTTWVVEDVTERKQTEELLSRRAEILARQLAQRYDMVGESPAMQQVYEFIRKVAPTDAGVLICGESGTGKEMVARAMHRHSRRRDGPLEVVNCGAVPPTLLESELFGHVRGAFTGAVADKPGRFELASGGTLFLDEVVELSPESQAKLLRAIEEGMVRRVGDTRDRPADVRLVAATNRDPQKAVLEGRLRQDLFYRLDRLRVTVPPLRARKEDIPLLATHFLSLATVSLRGEAREFSPDTLSILRAYGWPGNVRELKNVVERMTIMSEGPVLTAEQVPADIRAAAEAPSPRPASLRDVEGRHILRVLRQAGGNKKRAAAMLGINRSTLYAKLRKIHAQTDSAQRQSPRQPPAAGR